MSRSLSLSELSSSTRVIFLGPDAFEVTDWVLVLSVFSTLWSETTWMSDFLVDELEEEIDVDASIVASFELGPPLPTSNRSLMDISLN